MLHDLPELPDPAAAAWAALDAGDWAAARVLLDPSIRFEDGRRRVTGRTDLARHLAAHPRPRPPRAVEVRDGRITRWVR
jgi:hypothetical protein